MKKRIPIICNSISFLMLIAFAVKSFADYSQYTSTLNSAPFYIWVLVNEVYLIIPAMIVFVIGRVLQKHF